jgi:hypothetical protein
MPTVVQPTALAPYHSDYEVLAKINNNLVNLFKLMSGNKWTGQFVNIGQCLCSESLIMQAINNNIVSFFAWFALNGGSGGGNVQAGIVAIPNGASSLAVVFATPFSAAPAVVAVVIAPNNAGFVISFGGDGSQLTANGFTAMLGAPVPNGNYKLAWIANPTTQ